MMMVGILSCDVDICEHFPIFLLLGVLVGLEQTSHTVVKTEGSVEVCVVLAPDGCSVAFPFNIHFMTLRDSAST